MKFKVEVEYSDDGPAMAGGNYGRTMQRASIMEVECLDRSRVEEAVKVVFSQEDHYYTTLRRIGEIRPI